MTENGYAHPHALVSTDWVASHKADPGVRIVEVSVDTTAYASGHIPGAVGWDWKEDLQRRPVRDIPSQAEWEALLTRSGIGNDDLVVLYGDTNNWFAAFAYWLFTLYGHGDVALMDGGRVKWVAEGRELTVDVPVITPSPYVAQVAESRSARVPR